MANLAAPHSPPTSKRRIESPPPAPGRRRCPRKSGQVLLDAVEVRLVSGNVLGSCQSALPNEFWYTGQLRSQIAAMLGIEVSRLMLADSEGNTVSDEDCVTEGSLTAIVAQPHAVEEASSGRKMVAHCSHEGICETCG